MGSADFKSVGGHEYVSGGFDPHTLPPNPFHYVVDLIPSFQQTGLNLNPRIYFANMVGVDSFCKMGGEF